MKAAIVSALAVSAAILGACATTPTNTASLSGSEMVAELAAVSQGLRDLNAAAAARVYLEPAQGPALSRRTVRLRLLHQLEQLATRRADLRDGLAARRESLTADEIRVLIAEIDRDLGYYDDVGPGQAGVGAGPSRPLLGMRYTGGDFWASPDPNSLVSRQTLESTGMRHSQWRRTYRLKKDREELWTALRKHAVAAL